MQFFGTLAQLQKNNTNLLEILGNNNVDFPDNITALLEQQVIFNQSDLDIESIRIVPDGVDDAAFGALGIPTTVNLTDVAGNNNGTLPQTITLLDIMPAGLNLSALNNLNNLNGPLSDLLGNVPLDIEDLLNGQLAFEI